jgi:hypothetical protein
MHSKGFRLKKYVDNIINNKSCISVSIVNANVFAHNVSSMVQICICRKAQGPRREDNKKISTNYKSIDRQVHSNI